MKEVNEIEDNIAPESLERAPAMMGQIVLDKTSFWKKLKYLFGCSAGVRITVYTTHNITGIVQLKAKIHTVKRLKPDDYVIHPDTDYMNLSFSDKLCLIFEKEIWKVSKIRSMIDMLNSNDDESVSMAKAIIDEGVQEIKDNENL